MEEIYEYVSKRKTFLIVDSDVNLCLRIVHLVLLLFVFLS